MIFVNQKIVKNRSFNAHPETILIMKKLVIRQLRFLSLSLAFTVQLSAMETRTTVRKLALGKVAAWDLKALDQALSPRAPNPAVSPPSATGSAKSVDRTGLPPRYPKASKPRADGGSSSGSESFIRIKRNPGIKVGA